MSTTRWLRRGLAPKCAVLAGLCVLLGACGGEDGGAPAVSLSVPSGHAPDTDFSPGARLRRLALPETTVVVNPAPVLQSSDNPEDPAAPGRFAPVGIAVDASGNLYITQRDKSIRKITPQGMVSLQEAGTGGTALPAESLTVAADDAGNVQVTDTENCLVRRITPAGRVTTTTLPNPSASPACAAMRAAPGHVSAARR